MEKRRIYKDLSVVCGRGAKSIKKLRVENFVHLLRTKSVPKSEGIV